MIKRGSIQGQISVFVIIAIVVVALASIVFYAINKNKGSGELKSDLDKPGLDSLKDSFLDCMKITSKDSLQKIGVQGGYYKKPDKYVDLSWTFVPYYYFEGTINYPDKSKIENELSSYIDDNFLSCIKSIDFNEFTLDYKTPKTKTVLSKGEAKFTIDLPLTIKKGEETMLVQLKTLPISINSSLYEITEVAKYIVEENKKDDRYICITCLANMAEERNLYINLIDLADNSVIYVISENHTSSEPYSFEFLGKYETKELDKVDLILPPGGKSNGE